MAAKRPREEEEVEEQQEVEGEEEEEEEVEGEEEEEEEEEPKAKRLKWLTKPTEPMMNYEQFTLMCARFNITRKSRGTWQLVNSFMADALYQLVGAAMLDADSQGKRTLTKQNFQKARKHVREIPDVLV